ncbi:MAG: hypothetical protein JKY52_19155 [Flavobacteriales bacterium]|nr:hypothetical protein [Flavobacteriales bacterium]
MAKSRKSRKHSKRSAKPLFILLFLLGTLGTAAFYLKDNITVRTYASQARRYVMDYFKGGGRTQVNAFKMTEANYGSELDEIAEKYDLPAPFLKALIVLECSGRKPVRPRYEKHIFKKLKKVRDENGRTFEKITQNMIADASDEALKNLSKSWGPFQLMGYKCLYLEVHVNDIRGDDALEWGAKWIKLEYGHLLRKERYQDAFHYHNTGSLYPKSGDSKTYDPLYVEKGMKYIDYFD